MLTDPATPSPSNSRCAWLAGRPSPAGLPARCSPPQPAPSPAACCPSSGSPPACTPGCGGWAEGIQCCLTRPLGNPERVLGSPTPGYSSFPLQRVEQPATMPCNLRDELLQPPGAAHLPALAALRRPLLTCMAAQHHDTPISHLVRVCWLHSACLDAPGPHRRVGSVLQLCRAPQCSSSQQHLTCRMRYSRSSSWHLNCARSRLFSSSLSLYMWSSFEAISWTARQGAWGGGSHGRHRVRCRATNPLDRGGGVKMGRPPWEDASMCAHSGVLLHQLGDRSRQPPVSTTCTLPHAPIPSLTSAADTTTCTPAPAWCRARRAGAWCDQSTRRPPCCWRPAAA